MKFPFPLPAILAHARWLRNLKSDMIEACTGGTNLGGINPSTRQGGDEKNAEVSRRFRDQIRDKLIQELYR